MKRLIQVGLVAASIFVGTAWAQAVCPEGTALVGVFSGGAPDCAPQAGGGNGGGGSSVPRYIPPKVIYKPDSWGAVAFNSATSRYGSASKQTNKQTSKQAALNDCDQQGCKVLSTYSNQCVAFVGGDKHVVTRFSLNSRIAEQEALAACSKKTSNCQILLSECSLPS